MKTSPARPLAHRSPLSLCAGLALLAGLLGPGYAPETHAQEAQGAPDLSAPLKLVPADAGAASQSGTAPQPGTTPQSGAASQLTPPITLLPEGEPAKPRIRAAPDPADPDAPQDIEGIEISRLTELDPESVGILDPQHGGFSGDLWQGTQRRTVERLLPQLPGAPGSATMRDLARRLLLSNAAPPAAAPGQTSDAGTNLLALRVGRLAAMGDFEGLSGLLEAAPQRYDNEAVARARVETLLLDGRGETACQEVRIRVAELAASVYWRKALVYCQLLEDDRAGANLALALLREEGAEQADPVFFALADALTGVGELDAGVSPASALHLAMFQSTGRPLPIENAEQASPGLLVLLARTPANSLKQRTAAAERAVGLGLMDPGELAELYLEHGFDSAQRANAVSASESLAGAERRALFYQAAHAQDLVAVRAEILNLALSTARDDGSYGVTAQVLEPLVAEIDLQPELSWFAETAGRVLYAAGRFEHANAWFALARQQSQIDPEGVTSVAALWPYSRLAGGDAAAWDGDLARWADTRPDLSPDAASERQLLLRTAFQALGQSDPLIWSDLVGAQSAGPPPDPALVYALAEASLSGRLGETVMLALLALGEDGPGGAHPLALHEVLTALGRVDLAYEARLLAIEAAVANGI